MQYLGCKGAPAVITTRHSPQLLYLSTFSTHSPYIRNVSLFPDRFISHSQLLPILITAVSFGMNISNVNGSIEKKKYILFFSYYCLIQALTQFLLLKFKSRTTSQLQSSSLSSSISNFYAITISSQSHLIIITDFNPK